MTSMTQPGRTPRAAVIGCGRIGTVTGESVRARLPPGWVPLSHAEAIVANRGVELAALCDVDADRLSAAAAAYGVTSCFTDYRALLTSVRPDIVTVATRTEGRPEIVIAAAEHGVRGMHIEKPIARNMIDCDRALTALDRHGVHTTYGTTRRYMDIYRRAKQMVDAGEIGELEEIAVDNGHTLLLWNHPHSTDLLLFFAGTSEVESVQAACGVGHVEADGMRVDDDPIVDHACFQFANGVRGLITGSRGMNTRLSGSKGQLVIYADGTGLEIFRGGTRQSPYFLDRHAVESGATVSGTQTAIAEIIEALKAPREPGIALRHIRTGLLMLLAAAWSSLQDGRRVRLDDVPAEFEVTGRLGSLYA